ncbi:hypothetical protein N9908_01945 [Akkermansiaceae bacterium]|nr:hypothetical protein [Akkermansiaceae bacterium]MDB4300706.1 hypothetical protein [bacterium]MDB4412535.1 hypothetical protein [bacterium]MDB4554598.1 hypothetical protein [Akkermansiaceae bacterium]
MKRNHFLVLALGAGICASGVSGAERSTRNSLSGWAKKYGFSLNDRGGLVSLEGNISHKQMAQGLQELASLADAPMHAEGNLLKGFSADRPFEVSLKQQ